ncbi:MULTISPECIES: 50S ribosomal protein L30 [Lactobacillales]|jgi:large subunit ribosomal protein L30|uniref:Large ribosomal subunit protein uL30 n=1 Tax=Enterococcus aquimarinus TaxID=328396 RepID=A0A1L8QWH0_9ENTE|nr:50S ribosomal protein L30 [Enterococcus aquimarinus]MBP8692685.1 50S ribosomal protein L30 [Enterococcus sp.]MBP9520425.1 50S ribosomal protein L30 [Enterococcus sp.]MBP9638187.1 50S ribosomal protein L30 [Enterococcus sp.]MCC9273951.1 50S ribosomal protein L30 [Enterococcus aquimarinus]OJG11847.1 50S ribosomal protein L30 [Enterococcus aquimarinus]
MAELKITLKRSVIGRPQNQKDTVKALGLNKVNSSVVKPVNDAINGMVNTIAHLVEVEEVK